MTANRHPLKVGVLILPDQPWDDASKTWLRAEVLDFAHAWTYDHLTWRTHRDLPWFGAVPTLTAAAVATTRIRLGTLVASANFRHPVPFAKELITLDDVSDGRLTAGLGAGATGWDTTMLGQARWDRAERTERFEEFVALTDLLLREPRASFDGRYYSAVDARMHPGCVQRPRVPFAIAASEQRGMKIAAAHGQLWVTTGSRTRPDRVGAAEGAKEVRAQIALLEDVCISVGRDPTSIGRMIVTGPRLDSGLSSPDSFSDTAGRYSEVGVTDLIVPWPRLTDPYRANLATFERIFTP
jgi:alkanesulfonate monooxygenase SsuD/methylene tetrahydromethanopterin reductase-like flavin-dependent oxidoreductase (luciferase family)